MHRVLRCMICFLLICSLLVNFLPTRAEAISTGVAVSAGIVAGAIIYGLGVSIGDHPDEFNSLVSDAISAMETAGVLVTNGLMDVMSLGSGLFGVKSDAIQSLFDWLWSDSGALDPAGGLIPASQQQMFMKSMNGMARNNNWESCYGIFGYNPAKGYVDRMALSRYPFVLEADGNYYSYNPSTGYRFTPSNFSPDLNNTYGSDNNTSYARVTGDDRIIYFGTLDGFDVSVHGDYTTNFIANPGISLAEGYPEWHANSVVLTDSGSEGVRYYPIALGNSMEETQSFTQEQVWAGAGTYVDSESVPGTGDGTITVPDNVTLKDILAGVLSIPHSIATGIEKVVAAVVALPAAILDGLRNPKPPDDHNNFALADLKNFFPFCIPFDLYAFFQLLNADPVAPVLSWEIQDLSGQTYALSVDLAEWDSVAQLFRRLQLFLFITGLAAASRKFIKW